jgi:hypothetical protein
VAEGGGAVLLGSDVGEGVSAGSRVAGGVVVAVFEETEVVFNVCCTNSTVKAGILTIILPDVGDKDGVPDIAPGSPKTLQYAKIRPGKPKINALITSTRPQSNLPESFGKSFGTCLEGTMELGVSGGRVGNMHQGFVGSEPLISRKPVGNSYNESTKVESSGVLSCQ